MNSVLWFLINRPGLLAGLLPFLLLASFWYMSYVLRRRALARRVASQHNSLPDSAPDYFDDEPDYLCAEPEAQVPSEYSDGLLSQIRSWAAHYLVTHFAVASVLGAVAFSGILVISILSRLKFTSAWAILIGVLLFLAYLVFVSVIIFLVNKFNELILRKLGKRKL